MFQSLGLWSHTHEKVQIRKMDKRMHLILSSSSFFGLDFVFLMQFLNFCQFFFSKEFAFGMSNLTYWKG